MKEQEDIIFVEPDVKNDWEYTVVETEYASLYEELKHKCAPINYLPPNNYDKEKADIAHEICLQLQNAGNNIVLQKQLRHRAIVELGIHFNSHALRDKLGKYSFPAKYTEKFKTANELYSRVRENGDDVEVLEKIQTIIENELLCETIESIESRKIKREKKQEANQRIFAIILLIFIFLLLIIVAIISNN